MKFSRVSWALSAFTFGIAFCSSFGVEIDENDKAVALNGINYLEEVFHLGRELVQRDPLNGLLQLSTVDITLMQYVFDFDHEELMAENDLFLANSENALEVLKKMKISVENETIQFDDYYFFLLHDAKRLSNYLNAKAIINMIIDKLSEDFLACYPENYDRVVSEIQGNQFKSFVEIFQLPSLLDNSKEALKTYLEECLMIVKTFRRNVDRLSLSQLYPIFIHAESFNVALSGDRTKSFSCCKAENWLYKSCAFLNKKRRKMFYNMTKNTIAELKKMKTDLENCPDEGLIEHINSNNLGRFLTLHQPQDYIRFSAIIYTNLNAKKAQFLKLQILEVISNSLKFYPMILVATKDSYTSPRTVSEMLQMQKCLSQEVSENYHLNYFI